MSSRFVEEQQYTPYVRQYVEGAHKEYADLQKDLRNTYDTNVEHYDALQEAADNMQSLDFQGDNDLKKAAFDAAKGDIEKAAKLGDYENQSRAVRKATRDFTTRYKPIAEQVANQQAYAKSLEDMVKLDADKGGISRETANKALQMSNYIYNAKGGLKKGADGRYSGYSGYKPTGDVDEMKLINDYTKDWKSDERASNTGLYQDKGGIYMINKKNKHEYVNEKELKDSITPMLRNDSRYMGYLNQKALFATYDKQDTDLSSLAIENHLKGETDKILATNKNAKTKLTPKEAEKIALNRLKSAGFMSVETINNLTPEQRLAYHKNAIIENNLGDAINFAAKKAGFDKYDETLDIHALPKYAFDMKNGLGEYAPAPPPQTYNGQVYSTPINGTTKAINSSNFTFEDYLNSQGIETASTHLENALGTNKNEDVYTKGVAHDPKNALSTDKVKELRSQYEEINKKNSFEKINFLSKTNPMLKEIYDQIMLESNGKGYTTTQIASKVEKRYNTKLQSLGSSSDLIDTPRDKKITQEHKIGEGSQIGDISLSNVYNPKTHQMESFNTFAKDVLGLDMTKPDDVKKFTSSAEYEGQHLPKNHLGQHAFTYNGVQYSASGSVQREQYYSPTTRAYKIISENKSSEGTEANPIKFNSGITGIAKAGHLDKNGKFIAGDQYDENDRHTGRDGVIQLTQDYGHLKKGDYITLTNAINIDKDISPYENAYNKADVTMEGNETKNKAVETDETNNGN